MSANILSSPQTIIETVATATGSVYQVPRGQSTRAYQGNVVGTGAVSATIVVDVSNDGVKFDELGTITLSGTTSDSDGFPDDGQWPFVRATVSAISGTGAIATLKVAT